MKNRIAVHIEFYFKGKRYAPSAEIDLDDMMQQRGTLPPLHDIIAKTNGFDSYTHEYDVMIMEDVRISHVEGFVAEHIRDGALDMQGFEKQWREIKLESMLQSIADKHLRIGNLEKHADIHGALLAAYKCGESSSFSRPRSKSDDYI